MKMIPALPHKTESTAEMRVFDQLSKSFSKPDENGWFAMHSLNMPVHEYKRFGEIDFVVCGPDALIVLEVKGGGVSCQNGIWTTTDRYGKTSQLRESPFTQAEKALHGLRKKIGEDMERRFAIGYGVITPDVKDFPPSCEWDRQQLADASDFRNFERWLRNLVSYWRTKPQQSRRHANPDDLKKIQQLLRPDFETAYSILMQVDNVEQKLIRLSEEQFAVVDMVEDNPRVMCQGGAGTGKTVLALEIAKRWATSGKNVLIACQSPWLKGYIASNPTPGITVGLVDAVEVEARRAGLDAFDALVLDEGQDALNMDGLDKLDRVLAGGLESGNWCIFHDVNNQSGLCGQFVPEAYQYLRSLKPCNVPLRRNFRNTTQIMRLVQQTLNADLGASAVGEGPEIRQVRADDSQRASEALEHELYQLIQLEGFYPSQIVVLSPVTFRQSVASKASGKFTSAIRQMDSFSPSSGTRSFVGFAQIQDFKGLESEVVILVDLPEPGSDDSLRAHQYVGMSRARALLSLITSPAHN